MRREGGLALVIAAIVVAMLRGKGGANTPVNPSEGKEEKRGAEETAPPPESIGRRLLCAQLGRKDAALLRSVPPGRADERQEAVKAWKGVLNETALSVLLVTVPDPRASHLDWAFDSDVAAVRRAHERLGFVLQRFELPWASKDASAEALTGAPGAQLLRRVVKGPNGDQVQFALVYLIGEISTGGVDRRALALALQERALLLEASARSVTALEGAHDEVRIVGPTFSGSAESLHEVLRESRLESGVAIVSGAATSRSIKTILSSSGPPVVTYRTTLHTDDALVSALDQVLSRLRIKDEEVAVLRESTTGYGKDLETELEKKEYLRIPFPMSIGALRMAYLEDGKGRPEERAQPGRRAESGLGLDLRDEVRPLEAPGPASRLTPISIDLLLDEITHMLGQREIRALLLIATDVRDKLFLGSELKRRLPDLQLITTESNVLYLQPEVNRYLRGMLVLSTYPLLLRDRSWLPQSSRPDQLLFANEGAEGTFNATLLQLEAIDKGASSLLTDYGHPLCPRGNAPGRPRVWATVVGAGTMLPLSVGPEPGTCASAEASADVDMPAGVEVKEGDIGLPSEPSVFLTLCLLVLESLLLWLAREKHPRWKHWKAALCAQHEWYTLSLFLTLVGIVLPLLTLSLHGTLSLHVWFRGTLLVPLPVFAVVTFARRYSSTSQWIARKAALAVPQDEEQKREQKREQREERRELHTARFYAIVACAFCALGAGFCAWTLILTHLDSSSFSLFRHRALEIEQGVSPLAPWVLAGVILALWLQWLRNRTRFLADVAPLEAALPHLPMARGRFLLEAVEVGVRLRQVFPELWRAILLGSLTVLGLYRLSPPLETLETVVGPVPGWIFGLILTAGILGGFVGTLWATWRLVIVWLSFARLLHRFEDLIITLPFGELKKTLQVTANLSLWPSWHGSELQSMARLKWKALPGIPAPAVLRRREHRRHVAKALVMLYHSLGNLRPGDESSWVQPAREVVALELLIYFEWVFRHLRQLCVFLLLASVLNLALIASYPFQPQNEFQTVGLLLFGISIATVSWLILVMNRNAALSRAADTTPGEVTFDRALLVNLALFVVVPLTAVIGSFDGWLNDFVKQILPVLIKS